MKALRTAAALTALLAVAAHAAPPPAPAPGRTAAGATSPARPKTPFPSDAECQAMGPPISPIPFGPGEVLDFVIDALGAKAATMTMRTLPQRDGVLPLETTVETNTFFSKVRKVVGVAKSDLSTKTLRSQRYFEDAKENDTHRIADVTFRGKKAAKMVSTIDGHTYQPVLLPFGNDVTDVGGAVHLLRALPLREGQKLCFDVFGIRRIWRVWGTVQPKERVSMGLGEFQAFHLAGEAARLDLPDARREVHVWVSDDARRLPLAALGMIDLGAVRATLKGYSRPGEKSARAENKANIKW